MVKDIFSNYYILKHRSVQQLPNAFYLDLNLIAYMLPLKSRTRFCAMYVKILLSPVPTSTHNDLRIL